MNIPPGLLAELPTPCLVVDVAAADRNIQRAARSFDGTHVKLRPHFKAHKCTVLMRRQIDAGNCSGVTCATAGEAQVLADEGFDDILIANQVIDPVGLKALAHAAERARVSVAIDDIAHVGALTKLVNDGRFELGVLIEVDVGMGRCGVPLGSDRLLDLARSVDDTKGLNFLGLQGYGGHIVLKEDRELRRTLEWQAAQSLKVERERLESAGFACPVVSGAGTGTFDVAVDLGVLTEIQAGSYALMDARYGTLDLPFENALFCATTLISRRAGDAGVLNSGLKALSAEYGMPKAVDPSVQVLALSDEHARIALKPDNGLTVGDTVVLIPAHIDPAINLHDVMFAWDGGNRMERWAVDGRRKL